MKVQSNRRRFRFIATLIGILSAAPSLAQSDALFTRDVVPILQEHCQECHRPGQVAPMSLMTYEEVRPWAKSIVVQVSEKNMPPWRADSTVRRYRNDRSLSDEDIDTLVRWAKGDARRGNLEDMPPPREFHVGWSLGEPDLVLEMAAPYDIPGEGEDENRCFCFDLKFEEDRWVNGLEVLPGNKRVVHHLALFIDEDRISDAKDAADPGPGYDCFGSPGFRAYILGGWAPGAPLKYFPEGAAILIPAGSKIVMQVHYHPSGSAESDQTRFGLHFADGPVRKAYRDDFVAGWDLNIPAGDANYVVEATRNVTENITLYSVAAHMHLIGKAMDIWIDRPDGKRVDLLKVPRYDFYGQTEYVFAEPVAAPKGSVITVRGVYDNTLENPNQPSNPPRDVSFGESTTDEMLVGVYHYTVDGETAEMAQKEKLEEDSNAMSAEDVMALLDENGDGKISKEEAPVELQRNFAFLDANKDGFLERNEVKIIAAYMSTMNRDRDK